MLDEAIEYLKQLQLQVQVGVIVSVGVGVISTYTYIITFFKFISGFIHSHQPDAVHETWLEFASYELAWKFAISPTFSHENGVW